MRLIGKSSISLFFCLDRKYEEEFNIGIIINRNRKYCTFW